MKVHFHSAQKVGGKVYAIGVANLVDKIAYTQEFKKLVKAGHISLLPRNESEQKMQAHKDEHAVKKAAHAAKTAQA